MQKLLSFYSDKKKYSFEKWSSSCEEIKTSTLVSELQKEKYQKLSNSCIYRSKNVWDCGLDNIAMQYINQFKEDLNDSEFSIPEKKISLICFVKNNINADNNDPELRSDLKKSLMSFDKLKKIEINDKKMNVSEENLIQNMQNKKDVLEKPCNENIMFVKLNTVSSSDDDNLKKGKEILESIISISLEETKNDFTESLKNEELLNTTKTFIDKKNKFNYNNIFDDKASDSSSVLYKESPNKIFPLSLNQLLDIREIEIHINVDVYKKIKLTPWTTDLCKHIKGFPSWTIPIKSLAVTYNSILGYEVKLPEKMINEQTNINELEAFLPESSKDKRNKGSLRKKNRNMNTNKDITSLCIDEVIDDDINSSVISVDSPIKYYGESIDEEIIDNYCHYKINMRRKTDELVRSCPNIDSKNRINNKSHINKKMMSITNFSDNYTENNTISDNYTENNTISDNYTENNTISDNINIINPESLMNFENIKIPETNQINKNKSTQTVNLELSKTKDDITLDNSIHDSISQSTTRDILEEQLVLTLLDCGTIGGCFFAVLAKALNIDSCHKIHSATARILVNRDSRNSSEFRELKEKAHQWKSSVYYGKEYISDAMDIEATAEALKISLVIWRGPHYPIKISIEGATKEIWLVLHDFHYYLVTGVAQIENDLDPDMPWVWSPID